ncbi:MAG: DUF1161 domain-containing protein, partial [Betaproteobacteria bacterium]|nr:DUF1161 domain-containing protein [Betaproteobacteria bacterium]
AKNFTLDVVDRDADSGKKRVVGTCEAGKKRRSSTPAIDIARSRVCTGLRPVHAYCASRTGRPFSGCTGRAFMG